MRSSVIIKSLLEHDKQSYLAEFMDRAINQYSEPERANVPKGHTIGASFNRNAAAVILGLTTLTHEQAAKRSGLSVGSIRTWSSNPQFKEECQQIQEQFYEFLKAEHKAGFNPTRIPDTALYNHQLCKLIAPVLNIGYIKLTMPKPTIQITVEPLWSDKETALTGMDAAMKMLDRERTRKADKLYIKSLLEGLKKYIDGK